MPITPCKASNCDAIEKNIPPTKNTEIPANGLIKNINIEIIVTGIKNAARTPETANICPKLVFALESPTITHDNNA